MQADTPGREDGYGAAGETIFQALLVALALVLVQVIIGLIRSYRSKGNGAQDKFCKALQQDYDALKRHIREVEETAREVPHLKAEIETLRIKVARLEGGT